jgi:hypothetical protein
MRVSYPVGGICSSSVLWHHGRLPLSIYGPLISQPSLVHLANNKNKPQRLSIRLLQQTHLEQSSTNSQVESASPVDGLNEQRATTEKEKKPKRKKKPNLPKTKPPPKVKLKKLPKEEQKSDSDPDAEKPSPEPVQSPQVDGDITLSISPVIPYVRRVEGLLYQKDEPVLQGSLLPYGKDLLDACCADISSVSTQRPIAKLCHGLDRVLFKCASLIRDGCPH